MGMVVPTTMSSMAMSSMVMAMGMEIQALSTISSMDLTVLTVQETPQWLSRGQLSTMLLLLPPLGACQARHCKQDTA
jgi:hypothetical protein